MSRDPVLIMTAKGLYCPAGDFHIDPTMRVPRALITHGHSDHACRGHGAYLASQAALPVLRHRLGRIVAEGAGWGERQQIGGVTVSFHPAGHVPGSAQIRIEQAGEVWVASGDYKLEPDGVTEPFEPVACHTFITECTFGLPIFRWQPQDRILADIASWWASNAALGKASILVAYSFGKAQRLMAGIAAQGPILTHPVVDAVTNILRDQGYSLPPAQEATDQITARTHPGALIIAPGSALSNGWADRFAPYSCGFASGWMALAARRNGIETAFTLSDHADWPGLNAAIKATGASRVLTTHGYVTPFARWLSSQGYDADVLA